MLDEPEKKMLLNYEKEDRIFFVELDYLSLEYQDVENMLFI